MFLGSYSCICNWAYHYILMWLSQNSTKPHLRGISFKNKTSSKFWKCQFTEGIMMHWFPWKPHILLSKLIRRTCYTWKFFYEFSIIEIMMTAQERIAMTSHIKVREKFSLHLFWLDLLKCHLWDIHNLNTISSYLSTS